VAGRIDLITAEDYREAHLDFLQRARRLRATVYSAPPSTQNFENAAQVVLNMGHLEGWQAFQHRRWAADLQRQGVQVVPYSTPRSRYRLHWKSYVGDVGGQPTAFLPTGNPAELEETARHKAAGFWQRWLDRLRGTSGLVQANLAVQATEPQLVEEVRATQETLATGGDPYALERRYLRLGLESSLALEEAVRLARPGQQVVLASPYINSLPTVLELAAAAQRGVQVILLTTYPDGPQAVSGLQNRRPLLELAARSGIRVYVSPQRREGSWFLYHVKAAAVEGQLAVVGSHNRTQAADSGYSLDVDLHLSDPQFEQQLRAELLGHRERYDMRPLNLTRGGRSDLSLLDIRAYAQGTHVLYRPDFYSHYLLSARYDSWLFYKQARLGYRFRPYALSQRYQWLTGVPFEQVPYSLRRLDEAMQQPSLGHRLNWVLGTDLYWEGGGVLGTVVGGLGRLVDRAIGAAPADDREEPGPAEELLRGVYSHLQSAGATAVAYVTLSMPISHIVGRLVESTYEFLLSNYALPEGWARDLYATARAALFGQQIVADIERGFPLGGGDVTAQVQSGLLSLTVNARRFYGQERFARLMMPLLMAFNPYDRAAQAENYAKYVGALQQLYVLLGKQVEVQGQREGNLIRYHVRNVGASRVRDIARQYDAVGRLLPANPLYYVPFLRRTLRPFDPETMPTLAGGPDEGLFSFEEVFDFVDDSLRFLTRLIFPQRRPQDIMQAPQRLWQRARQNINWLWRQQYLRQQVQEQLQQLRAQLSQVPATVEGFEEALQRLGQPLAALENLKLQLDEQRRQQVGDYESLLQPPAATPDPRQPYRKRLGPWSLRQARTTLQAAALALTINKVLDYFVFANRGADLFSQLLALPYSVVQGGEVFRQQLTGTLPAALALGVGLGAGYLAGHWFAEAVEVVPGQGPPLDWIDAVLQERNRWLQGLQGRPSVRRRDVEEAYQRLGQRPRGVELRYHTTAALLVGTLTPVLLQAGTHLLASLYNRLTGRDEGVEVDMVGFAVAQLLTRAAAAESPSRRQALLLQAHRYLTTQERQRPVQTLAHQMVSPLFQFPLALRESGGVLTFSFGVQLPPLLGQGFLLTFPVGVYTEKPPLHIAQTRYEYSLDRPVGQVDPWWTKALSFARGVVNTLTLGRLGGRRIWYDDEQRWLYGGTGLTWIPQSEFQRALEFVGFWGGVGLAWKALQPRPAADLRPLLQLGEALHAGAASLLALPFQVSGVSLRAMRHFLAFYPRANPQVAADVQSLAKVLGQAWARVPSYAKSYYAGLVLLRLLSDPAAGYVRDDEASRTWAYTELAPLLGAIPLGAIFEQAGFLQSPERLLQRAQALRQRRRLGRPRTRLQLVQRRLSLLQELTWRAMAGREAVAAEIAAYSARAHARGETFRLTVGDTPPVLPEGATAVERAFYSRYLKADWRAWRTRMRVAGLTFVGLALTGAVLTTLADESLPGPLGHALRLLARLEPEEEQLGLVRTRRRGLPGLALRLADMATFGRAGAYTDTAQPFVGMFTHGATLRSDKFGYRYTFYFQAQSEDTDISTSRFFMRLRTQRVLDLQQAVEQVAGVEQHDADTLRARLRGGLERERPFRVSMAETTAYGYSPGLLSAWRRRQLLTQHLSWQRPAELEMDFYGYAQELLLGFDLRLDQFYASIRRHEALWVPSVSVLGSGRQPLLPQALAQDLQGLRAAELAVRVPFWPQLLQRPLQQGMEMALELPVLGVPLGILLFAGTALYGLSVMSLGAAAIVREAYRQHLGFDLLSVQQQYGSATPEGKAFHLGTPARATVSGVKLRERGRLIPLDTPPSDLLSTLKHAGSVNKAYRSLEEVLNDFSRNYRDRLLHALLQRHGGETAAWEALKSQGLEPALQKLETDLQNVLRILVADQPFAQRVYGRQPSELAQALVNATEAAELHRALTEQLERSLARYGANPTYLMADFARFYEGSAWYANVVETLELSRRARELYDPHRHVRRWQNLQVVPMPEQLPLRSRLQGLSRVAAGSVEFLTFQLPDLYTVSESLALLLDDVADPYLREAAAHNLVLSGFELLAVPLLSRALEQLLPMRGGGALGYLALALTLSWVGQNYRRNPLVRAAAWVSETVQNALAQGLLGLGRVLGGPARLTGLPQLGRLLTERVTGPLLTRWWERSLRRDLLTQTLIGMVLPRSAYYGRLNGELGRQTWLGREPWVYGSPLLAARAGQELFLERSLRLYRGLDAELVHPYYLGQTAYSWDELGEHRFRSPAEAGRLADPFDLGQGLSNSLQAVLRRRQMLQDHRIAGGMMGRAERNEELREAQLRGTLARGTFPVVTQGLFALAGRYGAAGWHALLQVLDLRYQEELLRAPDLSPAEHLEAQSALRAGQAAAVALGVARGLTGSGLAQLGLALAAGYLAGQWTSSEPVYSYVSGVTHLRAVRGSFAGAQARFGYAQALLLDDLASFLHGWRQSAESVPLDQLEVWRQSLRAWLQRYGIVEAASAPAPAPEAPAPSRRLPWLTLGSLGLGLLGAHLWAAPHGPPTWWQLGMGAGLGIVAGHGLAYVARHHLRIAHAAVQHLPLTLTLFGLGGIALLGWQLWSHREHLQTDFTAPGWWAGVGIGAVWLSLGRPLPSLRRTRRLLPAMSWRLPSLTTTALWPLWQRQLQARLERFLLRTDPAAPAAPPPDPAVPPPGSAAAAAAAAPPPGSAAAAAAAPPGPAAPFLPSVKAWFASSKSRWAQLAAPRQVTVSLPGATSLATGVDRVAQALERWGQDLRLPPRQPLPPLPTPPAATQSAWQQALAQFGEELGRRWDRALHPARSVASPGLRDASWLGRPLGWLAQRWRRRPRIAFRLFQGGDLGSPPALGQGSSVGRFWRYALYLSAAGLVGTAAVLTWGAGSSTTGDRLRRLGWAAMGLIALDDVVARWRGHPLPGAGLRLAALGLYGWGLQQREEPLAPYAQMVGLGLYLSSWATGTMPQVWSLNRSLHRVLSHAAVPVVGGALAGAVAGWGLNAPLALTLPAGVWLGNEWRLALRGRRRAGLRLLGLGLMALSFYRDEEQERPYAWAAYTGAALWLANLVRLPKPWRRSGWLLAASTLSLAGSGSPPYYALLGLLALQKGAWAYPGAALGMLLADLNSSDSAAERVWGAAVGAGTGTLLQLLYRHRRQTGHVSWASPLLHGLILGNVAAFLSGNPTPSRHLTYGLLGALTYTAARAAYDEIRRLNALQQMIDSAQAATAASATSARPFWANLPQVDWGWAGRWTWGGYLLAGAGLGLALGVGVRADAPPETPWEKLQFYSATTLVGAVMGGTAYLLNRGAGQRFGRFLFNDLVDEASYGVGFLELAAGTDALLRAQRQAELTAGVVEQRRALAALYGAALGELRYGPYGALLGSLSAYPAVWLRRQRSEALLEDNRPWLALEELRSSGRVAELQEVIGRRILPAWRQRLTQHLQAAEAFDEQAAGWRPWLRRRLRQIRQVSPPGVFPTSQLALAVEKAVSEALPALSYWDLANLLMGYRQVMSDNQRVRLAGQRRLGRASGSVYGSVLGALLGFLATGGSPLGAGLGTALGGIAGETWGERLPPGVAVALAAVGLPLGFLQALAVQAASAIPFTRTLGGVRALYGWYTLGSSTLELLSAVDRKSARQAVRRLHWGVGLVKGWQHLPAAALRGQLRALFLNSEPDDPRRYSLIAWNQIGWAVHDLTIASKLSFVLPSNLTLPFTRLKNAANTAARRLGARVLYFGATQALRLGAALRLPGTAFARVRAGVPAAQVARHWVDDSAVQLAPLAPKLDSVWLRHSVDIAQALYGSYLILEGDESRAAEGSQHLASAAGRVVGTWIGHPLAALAATTVGGLTGPLAPLTSAVTYVAVQVAISEAVAWLFRAGERGLRHLGLPLEKMPGIAHLRAAWQNTRERALTPLWHTYVHQPRRRQQERRLREEVERWVRSEYQRSFYRLMWSPAEAPEPRSLVPSSLLSHLGAPAGMGYGSPPGLPEEPIWTYVDFSRPRPRPQLQSTLRRGSRGPLQPPQPPLQPQLYPTARSLNADLLRHMNRPFYLLSEPEAAQKEAGVEQQRQRRRRRALTRHLEQPVSASKVEETTAVPIAVARPPQRQAGDWRASLQAAAAALLQRLPGFQGLGLVLSASQGAPRQALQPTPQAPRSARVQEGAPFDQAFLDKVNRVAANLGMDPDHLLAVMSFETGGTFRSDIRNAAGSGATGLIQFMPATAAGLGYTTEQLAAMTPTEQLDVVEQYLSPYKGKLDSLEDAYMAVLYPAAVGKDSDHVLFQQGSVAYRQNRGLDVDQDGSITVGEATQRVRAHLEQVRQYREVLQENRTVEPATATASQVSAEATRAAGYHYNQGQTAQCAHFVREIYRRAGIELGVTRQPYDAAAVGHSRTGAGFANSLIGEDIGQIITDKSQLKPGDIVAWGGTYGGYSKDVITHVGIYVGDGMVVDRPTADKPVQLRSIDTFEHFVAAVRPHALAEQKAPASPPAPPVALPGQAALRDAEAVAQVQSRPRSDSGLDSALQEHEQALKEANNLVKQAQQTRRSRSATVNARRSRPAHRSDSAIPYGWRLHTRPEVQARQTQPAQVNRNRPPRETVWVANNPTEDSTVPLRCDTGMYCRGEQARVDANVR